MKPASYPNRPRWVRVVAVLLLASGPVWASAIAAAPSRALGVCVEGVVLVALADRLPRWGRVLGALAWAVLVCHGLVQGASRVLTDAELPLADLALLVRPLVVVSSDLYGPVAYVALVLAAALPLGIAAVGERALWLLAPRALPPAALGALALALVLPGSASLAGVLAADAVLSARMASDFRAERARRDTDRLASRVASRRPDVQVVVVESYGMVTAHLPASGEWRATLRRLEVPLKDDGWHVVSGVGVAPVHGSRSWVADASVFTGLKVSHQSDYERVVRRADELVTLPSWFADAGWSTLLVRPTDRERPGVQLINHFGFQHTVFFDDLGYRGPSVGWGFVPDQYTMHHVNQRVWPTLPSPRLGFVHLASSHVPWERVPPLLDDPDAWNEQEGARAWDTDASEHSAWQTLRLVARRFRPPSRQPADILAIQRLYVRTIDYCLEAVLGTLVQPSPEGTLVLVMGDHQPPFLAPDQPPHVPLHVLASDPALLEPFRAAGFVDGLVPPQEATVSHHDLLPLLVDVVSP
jgi:hypothetical protein